MSPWEDDRFLNISAYKAVNHWTLYCNLSCQHQDFWTDMEELPETDWILIRRLLLPAAIVVGAAATRTLLLTWLLWRTLATVSNKSNHKNSEPTKRRSGGSIFPLLSCCCLRIIVLCSVLSGYSMSLLPAGWEKCFHPSFLNGRYTSLMEKRKIQGWRERGLHRERSKHGYLFI